MSEADQKLLVPSAPVALPAAAELQASCCLFFSSASVNSRSSGRDAERAPVSSTATSQGSVGSPPPCNPSRIRLRFPGEAVRPFSVPKGSRTGSSAGSCPFSTTQSAALGGGVKSRRCKFGGGASVYLRSLPPASPAEEVQEANEISRGEGEILTLLIPEEILHSRFLSFSLLACCENLVHLRKSERMEISYRGCLSFLQKLIG